MASTLETLKSRTSANNFDKTATISESEIKELVEYATQAPCSFNIQHWRFVAVTDKALQEKIKAAAWGQAKVADAAVLFVVLGDLRGVEKLPDALAPMLKAGGIDQKAHDGWLGMANGMYKDKPQLQRDEAIRSGSMAAMNLMLAAHAKGYVSGPMIGFDPAQVMSILEISDRYVPVMLLPVGKAAPGNWPRKPRFTVDQVLSFNKGKQF